MENQVAEHDFTLVSEESGMFVARVWHSDLGEWTIDTIDGPSYKRVRRQDAIDLVTAQYGAVTGA